MMSMNSALTPKVNSIHIHTYLGRCGWKGVSIAFPIRSLDRTDETGLNTGSVRKPNLPQCRNDY